MSKCLTLWILLHLGSISFSSTLCINCMYINILYHHPVPHSLQPRWMQCSSHNYIVCTHKYPKKMCTIMQIFKLTTSTQVVLAINHPNHCHSAHCFEVNSEVSTIMLSIHCELRKLRLNINSFLTFVAVTPLHEAETNIKRIIASWQIGWHAR